jgi:general nucleoside transport system ATP-binding protein
VRPRPSRSCSRPTTSWRASSARSRRSELYGASADGPRDDERHGSPSAAPSTSARPAVELVDIDKGFFGVKANDGVSLELRRGEIHALLGENGAGKTTLCSVLSGLYRPDAGRIVLDGEEVSFRSPRDALDAGIGMVYQHFRLVPNLTVAENLALGHRDLEFRISRRRLQRDAAALAERYQLPVDPAARVWQLSVGEQQRVEILKLLYRDVRVLILDEPTAVLTPQEAQRFFATLRLLAEEGRSVVFVTHKLGEVLDVSDRVTVLRGGSTSGRSRPPTPTPACWRG